MTPPFELDDLTRPEIDRLLQEHLPDMFMQLRLVASEGGPMVETCPL